MACGKDARPKRQRFPAPALWRARDASQSGSPAQTRRQVPERTPGTMLAGGTLKGAPPIVRPEFPFKQVGSGFGPGQRRRPTNGLTRNLASIISALFIDESAEAMKRARKTRQGTLELRPRGRGGRRSGAGRKPRPGRRPIAHRPRQRFAARYPLHVTLRVRQHVFQLRSKRCFSVIRAGIEAARERFGCRITDFSVQGNHIHFILEAKDARALGRSMQGLCIRIAKRLNRVMRRTGAVFAERYHMRVLRSPREVHNALNYVLHNRRRHAVQFGEQLSCDWVDPYSSAAWFGGWKRPLKPQQTGPPPVAKPRTWLLGIGWRRHGLLCPDQMPKGRG